MIRLLDVLAKPLLRAFEPEDAHALAIKALKLAPTSHWPADDPRLAVAAFGLSFPNPVGIAAGFDKNAEVVDAVRNLGCGFAEVGTVTPQAQSGNPRPRLFRLKADRAVINRLGFNNEGHAAVLARLSARRPPAGIVGVNIGANRDAADRVADYVAGVEAFADAASYFTVNISSPNTPGLRDLQRAEVLDNLLARVTEARDRAAERSARRPLLLKIAPDLSLGELDTVVAAARRYRLDGMVVSNTTVSRPAGLRDRAAGEQGGLSGRPLFPLSTRMLAETHVRAEGAFALVGVGGIDSGATALAKIRAGAALIQLYTGLIFRGAGLIGEIKAYLTAEVDRRRLPSLAAAAGLDAAAITAEPWPH